MEIIESIIKSLTELRDERKHDLNDKEIESLAAMVNAIAKSTKDTRMICYVYLGELARHMKEIATKEISAILKKLKGGNNNSPIEN